MGNQGKRGASSENSESSVVMALSELVSMEESRIRDEATRRAQQEEDERRAREETARAQREAEQRAAEARAQAERVAEAEARLRVEADRERDARIAAMRAELARAEADRLALRADLEQRALAPAPTNRPTGWALAFGLSSLVAASLAGLLAVQSHQPPAIVVAAAPVAAPVAASPAHEEPALEREAPVVDEAPAAPVAEAPRAPRGPRRHTTERTGIRPTTTDDLGLGTDDGTDEVLSDAFLHSAEHGTHR